MKTPEQKKIPRKYQPEGFEIIYDDRDVIVGIKSSGILTVGALWERENTVHNALNHYVRKGSFKSKKCVFVVHRLDQDTSGLLVFAKTEQAQNFLKDNWKDAVKTYYAVVHGQMSPKKSVISSYLLEDEDYIVHTTDDKRRGKLAQTEYEVIKENLNLSLVKINLLTGRKNQIRVHFADSGHSVVGDAKYGKGGPGHYRLALHSQGLSFTHPFSGKRLSFETELPEYFYQLIGPLDEKSRPVGHKPRD
jgi:tRNA pseudouridine32 synthase/23S rRNA pseudouridine746 synthase/23S rRNA pseudouridine1911/1915/1917 synthase